MKQIKNILWAFVILIVVISVTFLWLFIDDSELVGFPLDSSASIEAFKTEKVMEALDRINEDSEEITIDLSEEDLNMLAHLYLKDQLAVLKDTYYLSDFVINTNKDSLDLAIKIRYADLVPTIIRVTLLPVIEEGEIAFEVSSAKIGKLPLPTNKILEVLSNAESDQFRFDEQEGLILINTELPKQLILQSIKINNEKLTLGLQLKINSIMDIVELIALALPEELEVKLRSIIDETPDFILHYLENADVSSINNVFKDLLKMLK